MPCKKNRDTFRRFVVERDLSASNLFFRHIEDCALCHRDYQNQVRLEKTLETVFREKREILTRECPTPGAEFQKNLLKSLRACRQEEETGDRSASPAPAVVTLRDSLRSVRERLTRRPTGFLTGGLATAALLFLVVGVPNWSGGEKANPGTQAGGENIMESRFFPFGRATQDHRSVAMDYPARVTSAAKKDQPAARRVKNPAQSSGVREKAGQREGLGHMVRWNWLQGFGNPFQPAARPHLKNGYQPVLYQTSLK